MAVRVKARRATAVCWLLCAIPSAGAYWRSMAWTGGRPELCGLVAGQSCVYQCTPVQIQRTMAKFRSQVKPIAVVFVGRGARLVVE